MTLVFAVMHLYHFFFNASVHSFLYFKKNLVLINRRNGPRYQRVLALRVFFVFLTGVILRGLIVGKFCVRCLCMFYVNLCTGLILWFLNNLWFDDLREE